MTRIKQTLKVGITLQFNLCAYLYAGEGGKVKEYVLKKDVNIFNANCKSDYFTLHKYVVDNNIQWLNINTLDRLKTEDWSFVLENDKVRSVLLNILKDLGYDGFFNYEYNSEMIDLAKKYGVHNVPTLPSEPAIGVIDSTSFILTNTYDSLDEILTLKKAQDYKDAEKKVIKTNVLGMLNLKKSIGCSDNDIFNTYKNIETLSLSKEELINFIRSIIDDYNKPSSFMENIKKEVEKNGQYIFRDNVITKDNFN